MDYVTQVKQAGLTNSNGRPQIIDINGNRVFTGKLDVKVNDWIMVEEVVDQEMRVYKRDANRAILTNADGSPQFEEGQTVKATQPRRYVKVVYSTKEEALSAMNFKANLQTDAEIAQLEYRATQRAKVQELFTKYGVTSKEELLASII